MLNKQPNRLYVVRKTYHRYQLQLKINLQMKLNRLHINMDINNRYTISDIAICIFIAFIIY